MKPNVLGMEEQHGSADKSLPLFEECLLLLSSDAGLSRVEHENLTVFQKHPNRMNHIFYVLSYLKKYGFQEKFKELNDFIAKTISMEKCSRLQSTDAMVAFDYTKPCPDHYKSCGNVYCQKKLDVSKETRISSRCSRCKIMMYCCRECQVEDWKIFHKKKCSPFTGTSGDVLSTGIYSVMFSRSQLCQHFLELFNDFSKPYDVRTETVLKTWSSIENKFHGDSQWFLHNLDQFMKVCEGRENAAACKDTLMRCGNSFCISSFKICKIVLICSIENKRDRMTSICHDLDFFEENVHGDGMKPVDNMSEMNLVVKPNNEKETLQWSLRYNETSQIVKYMCLSKGLVSVGEYSSALNYLKENEDEITNNVMQPSIPEDMRYLVICDIMHAEILALYETRHFKRALNLCLNVVFFQRNNRETDAEFSLKRTKIPKKMWMEIFYYSMRLLHHSGNHKTLVYFYHSLSEMKKYLSEKEYSELWFNATNLYCLCCLDAQMPYSQELIEELKASLVRFPQYSTMIGNHGHNGHLYRIQTLQSMRERDYDKCCQHLQAWGVDHEKREQQQQRLKTNVRCCNLNISEKVSMLNLGAYCHLKTDFRYSCDNVLGLKKKLLDGFRFIQILERTVMVVNWTQFHDLVVDNLYLMGCASYVAGSNNEAIRMIKAYLMAIVYMRRKHCQGCGQTRCEEVRFLMCSGCGVARYCSKSHQRMSFRKRGFMNQFVSHGEICPLLKQWKQDFGDLKIKSLRELYDAFISTSTNFGSPFDFYTKLDEQITQFLHEQTKLECKAKNRRIVRAIRRNELIC